MDLGRETDPVTRQRAINDSPQAGSITLSY